MTGEEVKKHNDKHQAINFLDEDANGKETLFAWVLDDIEIEVNLNRILFLQVHGAKLRLELGRRKGLTHT